MPLTADFDELHTVADDARARDFCRRFLADDATPKLVLGRNLYAASVASQTRVDAYIDDFTDAATHLGRPIMRLADIPDDALVLNAAGGRPLTARAQLDRRGVTHIDYFAFYRHAGLPLAEVRFNEGFAGEFAANRARYDWLHDRLEDEQSRSLLRQLLAFRLSYDITCLNGLLDREREQYFEDFLALRPDGETFLDVGCFDGQTSLEFARRCPGYRAIHAFEPEPDNRRVCEAALAGLRDCHLHPVGLSDRSATLRFSAAGSASHIVEDGALEIRVTPLDALDCGAPSFVKIDTEGAEEAALLGARATLVRHRPKLAIAAYHRPGDFWRLAERALDACPDYRIYLRHYTECIYETVLFCVPR